MIFKTTYSYLYTGLKPLKCYFLDSTKHVSGSFVMTTQAAFSNIKWHITTVTDSLIVVLRAEYAYVPIRAQCPQKCPFLDSTKHLFGYRLPLTHFILSKYKR